MRGVEKQEFEQDGKGVSMASLILAARSAFFQSLRHKRSSPGTKYQPFDNTGKKSPNGNFVLDEIEKPEMRALRGERLLNHQFTKHSNITPYLPAPKSCCREQAYM